MTPYLRCAACGEILPATSARADCRCGGLLDAQQCPRETGAVLRARFDKRRRDGDPAVQGSGVWRFRELLLPGPGPTLTHPEGNTSLYRRDAIARWVGHEDLALKHEGENPTGSFKDRGMTVADDPGGARGRHRGGLRLDRQHLRLDGGLRRAGRPARRSSSSPPARWRRGSSPRRSPTGRAPSS